MKKYLYLAIALLGMAFTASCSSDNGTAGRAEGSYATDRQTDLLGLPPTIPFETVHDRVTVRVKAVSDDFVDVTLPALTYTFGGQSMTIPNLTVSNVPVLDDGDGGAVVLSHSFMMKEGNRDVTGTMKAAFHAKGGLEMDVRIDRYGSMPFGIQQKYQSVER